MEMLEKFQEEQKASIKEIKEMLDESHIILDDLLERKRIADLEEENKSSDKND